MLKCRSIGKFNIKLSVIDRHPEVVRAIMKDLIVLRAEALGYNLEIEYIAIGPPFDETPENAPVSEYTPLIYQNEDGSARFEGWVRNPPKADPNFIWTNQNTRVDVGDLFRRIDAALDRLAAIHVVTGADNGEREHGLREELRKLAEAKGISMGESAGG